jgi:predicted TIM-barrel enzyme
MTTPYPPRGASSILGADRAVVAMVHLPALPGSPRASLSPREIARHAVEEARALAADGFDAILIENMHDAPYLLRG